MWHDLILAIDPEAVCHPPASTGQLTRLEATLGVTLPIELASLLREMNGVEVVYGLGLVWSTEEIAQRNRELRWNWQPNGMMSGYMPIDHLLFFSDRGNGDLYGFPITPEGVRNDVFLWDHEDDSRMNQASSLRGWLEGK